MRHVHSIRFDADSVARANELFWEKLQETFSDAQDTWQKTVTVRSLADVVAVQVGFGVRNAQRWADWQVDPGEAEEPEAKRDGEQAGSDEAAEAAPAQATTSPDRRETVNEESSSERETALSEEAPDRPHEGASEHQVWSVADTVYEPADRPVAANEEASGEEAEPAEPPEELPPDASGQDDLKRIRGIGPTIEKKLHDRGIYHFAQIADLDENAVAELDLALDFRGRIDREEWIDQARQLMKSERPE
ncbi:MAG TPA: hypothetical protein VKA18_11140 [Alphaproteobacteria bacterium]|nr:hypothetical protein [Alphaproteobacteria bacterium]